MMNNSLAYAETLDVLSNMSQTYIDKIPFFKRKCG